MVNKNHSKLSIAKQCKLMSLHRSGLYYSPIGESELNLKIMRLIDARHLEHPEEGVVRMCAYLNKDCDLGQDINVKRVRRLMRLMGIEAIYPKKNLSKPCPEHKVYPYLLKGFKITKPNQVWAADITYVPMASGFMYLIAVVDLYSRKVLSWSLSNTYEAEWCAECLREAIDAHGAPQIFNTDQGSQFTSEKFTTVLKANDVLISMDGKGRALDNAIVERLWRTVKYEYIYLHEHKDGYELYKGLQDWFDYYNNERRHSSLKSEAPEKVYEYAK